MVLLRNSQTLPSLRLDPPEIVQLLSCWFDESCVTLSLAGGSDAVAAGEGFSIRLKSKLLANHNDPLRAREPDSPRGSVIHVPKLLQIQTLKAARSLGR